MVSKELEEAFMGLLLEAQHYITSNVGRQHLERQVGKVQSIIAFEGAIRSGRLSADEKAENFAGNFMFMGYAEGGKKAQFKHIDTREYLK